MATTEVSGHVPFFLDTFLSRPASALPKGAQWVLSFDGCYSANPKGAPDYNEVLPVPAITKCLDLEPARWNVTKAIDTTLHTDYQTSKGCMFVQAVEIPGESTQTNNEGIQLNGYIRTISGGGRDPLQPINISFLETNVSFVDNVIRPWVIATSHLGLIARKGSDNYRCNISVRKLGVIAPELYPYVSSCYTFYGVCPINVRGEEFNYTQVTAPINRSATFIYHYYTIDSVTGNLAIANNSPNL